MIEQVAAYIAGVLLLVGAMFSLLAAIGMLRLPDLYARMHAASKAGTMGSGLVLIAIAVVAFDGPIILRALVGVVFLLLTTPVSTHLLARAAYVVGYRPTPDMKINDLEEYRENQIDG